jgi:hypothetical protein
VKYWLDTEFIEDGKTIDLISIGIVSEDGREYYAISTEFDEEKASDWVKENVIPQLEPRNQGGATFWKPRLHIKEDIIRFVLTSRPNFEKPEFWAYYAGYDWVTFCQLFGSMMELPKIFPMYCFPMYCRDIKQWCDQLGNPELPKQEKGEHNALADARWNKEAWEFLKKYETGYSPTTIL